jgi:hypothetical protein
LHVSPTETLLSSMDSDLEQLQKTKRAQILSEK